MKELLLEIGCEEMPASWLPSLTSQLAEKFSVHLDKARLARHASLRTFSSPRRFGFQLRGVAERQSDLEETVTGPPVSAAFASSGKPTQAAQGFARKHEVGVDLLTTVQTAKGEHLAFRRLQRGLSARKVLPGVLAATLRDLTFPKQMRWDAWLDDGYGELLFGRPIRWILYLHGGQIVPFIVLRSQAAQAKSVKSIKSGSITYGHRFFSKEGKPGRALRVRSFSEYRDVLANHFVVIDRDTRRNRLKKKLDACAKRVGGRVALAENQTSLLNEVPDLVEFPSVVTGVFPSEFLNLPEEVLRTTMIHHQHYFPVETSRGKLTSHFLAVTNIPRDNVNRIARNAEKVLVARLRDARFFWDADRKIRLEDRLDRLDTIIFHKKLGSYRAKVNRVRVLVEQVARDALNENFQVGFAAQAAMLSKADLTCDMVGEFPELQGIMGGVYAREQGEPEEVWKAIYYQYLPIGVEAHSPPSRSDLGIAAIPWAALALADKLDTIVGLFHAGEKPTGSRDPFGIRRQAQGIIRILLDLPELTGLTVRLSLGQLLEMAYEGHGCSDEATERRLAAFVLERLRYLLEERGFDIRNVRAVTHQSLSEIRPLDARRKLEVLPDLTESQDFQQLANLFKRVKNIARKLSDEEFKEADQSKEISLEQLLTEPAERALLDELVRRRSVIEKAVNSGENFRGAFSEAAAFGPAVDRFFSEVFVMVDDQKLRLARLLVMKKVEQLILKLADVAEIVPEKAIR